jgi:hypothetical protein
MMIHENTVEMKTYLRRSIGLGVGDRDRFVSRIIFRSSSCEEMFLANKSVSSCSFDFSQSYGSSS